MWDVKLNQVRAAIKPSDTMYPQISIPEVAQKEFIEAISMLWVIELRTFFQHQVAGDEMYLTPNSCLIASPLSLKKAIIHAATAKEPVLKQLDNFRDKWDISRFAYLVEALPKKDEQWGKNWGTIRECVQELRKARNDGSHEDLSDPLKNSRNDHDLYMFINSAMSTILSINELDPTSNEAKRIFEKLKRLRQCLFHENNDVHSQPSIEQ